MDELLPVAVDEIGPDEPPPMPVRDLALPIVHAERAQRVARIGMLRVDEERAVGAQRVEKAMPVEAGAVEPREIVLRKEFPAVRAARLPGMIERVDDPVVHRRAFA